MEETTQSPALDMMVSEFQTLCIDSLQILNKALQLNNENPDQFSDRMKDLLVESIIINLFGKWERFLEEVFIAYMLGETSSRGGSITRYVYPQDRDHAYRMIQNVNLYPDWSDVDKIIINANNFFKDGGPFSIFQTMKSEINALKRIRNAIAHTSLKARADFENLIQGKIGYKPDGITPAKFLIDYKTGHSRRSPTYGEHYINYLHDIAKLLLIHQQILEL